MNIARYIGIPYLAGGASFDGCNCWGLVQLVYLTEHNIDLPAYTSFAAGSSLFVPVDVPAAYDVALIANNAAGVINHCALLVDGELLHSLENTGVVLSRLHSWRSKIISWHRCILW